MKTESIKVLKESKTGFCRGCRMSMGVVAGLGVYLRR